MKINLENQEEKSLLLWCLKNIYCFCNLNRINKIRYILSIPGFFATLIHEMCHLVAAFFLFQFEGIIQLKLLYKVNGDSSVQPFHMSVESIYNSRDLISLLGAMIVSASPIIGITILCWIHPFFILWFIINSKYFLPSVQDINHIEKHVEQIKNLYNGKTIRNLFLIINIDKTIF